jgi:hypothetical protein
MAIQSAWCPVCKNTIMKVTSLEGEITAVICPEFESATKTCRMRKATAFGGPLAQLLERVSEDTLSHRGEQCLMV